MTARGFLVAVVLIAFIGFTSLIIAEHGFVGFFRELLSSSVGVQVFCDLAIALCLVLSWMRTDARTNRLPFVPYLTVTLVAGSIGPLAYLLHRELRRTRSTPNLARDQPPA